MNPSSPTESDLVTLASAHSASETSDRLKAILQKKKITLFAEIDHAAAASDVGLALRPTRVLIFGNPQAGTPLMQSEQTLGLDLPLRVLIWDDAAGQTWLTYRPLQVVARQHNLVGHQEAVAALSAALAALTAAAA